MRLRACWLPAAFALLAGACTAAAIEPLHEEAPTLQPSAATSPLPHRPEPRRYQQIQAMSDADLLRWILPSAEGRVTGITDVEIALNRWGRLTHIMLWHASKPTGLPGICELTGWAVGMKNLDEYRTLPTSLHDERHEPYKVEPYSAWWVAGSTIKGAAASVPGCSERPRIFSWPDAPSVQALHEAANLVEQAQMGARSGRKNYRYRCSEIHFHEGTPDFQRRTCGLSKIYDFTGDGIQAVKSIQCVGYLAVAVKGRCWEIDYAVETPGAIRSYTVRIGGSTRPRAVLIEQYMPPVT